MKTKIRVKEPQASAIVPGRYLTLPSLQNTIRAGVWAIFYTIICFVVCLSGGCAEGIAPKEQARENSTDYIKANYDCILKHIQDTNADYTDKAKEVSSGLRKSIKKYGLERMIDVRNRAYISRLDVARERINKPMSQEELDEKAKEIAEQYFGDIEETNVDTPIDFTKEAVIEAGRKKAIVDVLFYEKLLRSNPNGKPAADYRELVRSAFLEKEYSKLVSKQLSAFDGIYDAFLKSRVGLKGAFAEGGINKMRKFVKEYYKGQAEKIYPLGGS